VLAGGGAVRGRSQSHSGGGIVGMGIVVGVGQREGREGREGKRDSQSIMELRLMFRSDVCASWWTSISYQFVHILSDAMRRSVIRSARSFLPSTLDIVYSKMYNTTKTNGYTCLSLLCLRSESFLRSGM